MDRFIHKLTKINLFIFHYLLNYFLSNLFVHIHTNLFIHIFINFQTIYPIYLLISISVYVSQ